MATNYITSKWAVIRQERRVYSSSLQFSVSLTVKIYINAEAITIMLVP